MSFLEKLVRSLYTDIVKQKQDLPADLLFEMITSHSLYLQIMSNEAYPSAKGKYYTTVFVLDKAVYL